MRLLRCLAVVLVCTLSLVGAESDLRGWYVPETKSATGPCLCLNFEPNPNGASEQLDLAKATITGQCIRELLRGQDELGRCTLRFVRVGETEPSTPLHLLLNVGLPANRDKPVLIRTVRGTDTITRIYVEPRP
jgi:hypothetical protein